MAAPTISTSSWVEFTQYFPEMSLPSCTQPNGALAEITTRPLPRLNFDKTISVSEKESEPRIVHLRKPILVSPVFADKTFHYSLIAFEFLEPGKYKFFKYDACASPRYAPNFFTDSEGFRHQVVSIRLFQNQKQLRQKVAEVVSAVIDPQSLVHLVLEYIPYLYLKSDEVFCNKNCNIE